LQERAGDKLLWLGDACPMWPGGSCRLASGADPSFRLMEERNLQGNWGWRTDLQPGCQQGQLDSHGCSQTGHVAEKMPSRSPLWPQAASDALGCENAISPMCCVIGLRCWHLPLPGLAGVCFLASGSMIGINPPNGRDTRASPHGKWWEPCQPGAINPAGKRQADRRQRPD
jgi:hypothetical protein